MVSVDVKHHGYWSMDISYCSSQACIICAMALEGRHQHGREGTNEHVGDSLVPASPPKRVRAHKTKNLFLLVFYNLQTPYPMSTCLFSYIPVGFNLQTLLACSCVILVCTVLFNVCRPRDTDRIFVVFPAQFAMLQKLIELSLSIHIQQERE